MAAPDLIIGRKGDSLLGTVLNKQFGITTDFGDFDLPRKEVAWIHFRNPPQFEVDEIWLHSGDRLSGKVTDTAIRFRREGGKEIQVPCKAIHTVMLGGGIDSKARSLMKK